MKSFNVHSNSSKHSKRNKQRRNVMKNTFSRDIILPQIFSVHDRIQNCDNGKQVKNIFHVVDSNKKLKSNYPKNFTPIYFSTHQKKLPEVNLCHEIMTLLPYNQNQSSQKVNKEIVCNNLTVLARPMNALAASETDINAILKLVEIMYNSIQEMLQEVKQKQEIYQPHQIIQTKTIQKPTYVIKIDLKKFMNYLNEQCIRHNFDSVPLNRSNQNISAQTPYCKQSCLRYPTNNCKSFNILLQPRRMSFNITVCKFNSCSMDFFQRLATFYNTCNMTYNAAKTKPVPAVFIRDWHFRNVSQGYLLSVLLKHNNVMTLNVMRKLYFVIITSVSPNLNIEINFKLANGIFTAFETPPFAKLPFQVINWNDRHRNVIENSSKILFTPAFTYNIPDDSYDDLKRDTKSDNTLHNNISASDCSSTLKYESSSDCEESDYFNRSTLCSECGFLDLKSTESSTDLTLRESVKTLTLSIDNILSYHVLPNNRKDCGDMNFTNTIQEQYNIYNSTIRQSRTWMSKVFRESCKLKAEVVIPYLNSVMNETVFDRVTVSMEDCYCSFAQYCTQIGSRRFYKRFFYDLGNYFVHTLIVSMVYY